MRFLAFMALACATCCAQSGLDTTKWFSPDNQWIQPNADIDCVLNANTHVANGFLVMAVKQQSVSCIGNSSYGPQTQSYTDGTIFPKPAFPGFTYGTIRYGAQLTGYGNHNGLWLLNTECQATFQTNYGVFTGTCQEPHHYEVDVLDYTPQFDGSPLIGNNTIYPGSATGLTATDHTFAIATPTKLHDYMLRWTSTQLKYYLDGSLTNTINAAIPNTVKLFPLLSQEMTSGSGGIAGSYPVTEYVQYVRICSDPTAACNPGDPTMIFEDEFGNTGTVLSNVPTSNVQIN